MEYHHEPVTRYDLDFGLWSAPRGGICYSTPTPAERRAQEAVRALTSRIVARLARQREAAIDAACVTAVAEGWDVHVYEPPEPLYFQRHKDEALMRMRCIGIQFTPAQYSVPTVHFHQTPEDWEWDDDDVD